MATMMDPLVPETKKHDSDSNTSTLRKSTPVDIFRQIRMRDKSRIEAQQKLKEQERQAKLKHENGEKHESEAETDVDVDIVMIDSDNEINEEAESNHDKSNESVKKLKGTSIVSILMHKPNNEQKVTVEPSPQSKGVSLASLLTGTKKKEVKTKMITVQVNPDKLRSVLNPVQVIPDEEEEEIVETTTTPPPIRKSKGNKANPILKSGRFDIKTTKLKAQTRLVTLKVDPVKLKSVLEKRDKSELHIKKIVKKLNGKDSPIVLDEEEDLKVVEAKKLLPKGTMMNLFFKEVAERARKSSLTKTAKETPKLTRGQKEEVLQLRPLTKEMFHIYDKEDVEKLYEGHENPLSYFTPRQSVECVLDYSLNDFNTLIENYKESTIGETRISYTSTILSGIAINDIASRKYDNLSDSRLKKFLKKDYRSNREAQWCDLFRPTSYKEILQEKSIRKEINNWIQNAFKRLKKVDKSKREEILKKKRNKKSTNEYDDFINDFEDDDNETEEEIFVPSLIIEGPYGSGKTSSVYAIMKEQLQGIVFEINSSQSRAKKDISFHVKQVGTTQVVNKEKSGVILFDDVELIDEEEDREFWLSVTELLTYSYRPVIFTTTDLSKIPKNILDESTVCSFAKAEASIEKEYLDLACLSMGYMLSDDILNQFIKNDLRNSLLNLQMFCYRFETFHDSITEVNLLEDNTKDEAKSDLDQLISTMNLQDMEIFTKDYIPDEIEYQGDEDKLYMIEFYASKLFSNGSRSRSLKYNHGEDYLKSHPGCSFNRLSVAELAYEITPFIREMARVEADRRVEIEELENAPRSALKTFVLGDLMAPPLPRRRFEGDTENLLWSFPRV